MGAGAHDPLEVIGQRRVVLRAHSLVLLEPSLLSVPAAQAFIVQPALSVLGGNTQSLWVEVDDLLRSSIPRIERCTIDGVGHLLHLQRPEPVAREIAAFLARHPMAPP